MDRSEWPAASAAIGATEITFGTATRRSNALAALVRPSSSRHVSSCGWVALCERRRAGFGRLSGWQPVGNWVASAGEFSSIPVTRKRYPDNEQKNRDACAEKWPEAQAEQVAGVHAGSQERAETIPRAPTSIVAGSLKPFHQQ